MGIRQSRLGNGRTSLLALDALATLGVGEYKSSIDSGGCYSSPLKRRKVKELHEYIGVEWKS